MEEWIRNRVQLGWLIDVNKRTVFIYRPGTPVEELCEASIIEGEAPVDGFRLNLEAVWRGL